MSLLVETSAGVARVTLNRPDVHNAFDGELLLRIGQTFTALGQDPAVRVIVLAGAGKSFCAGADLAWMRSTATLDAEKNAQNALELAGLFAAIDGCPKPVVGRVHGAAMGGGVGLVACCDVVVAGPRAKFTLSEVRVGMAPAVISPFVVGKIGSSRARELFLTGDSIDAERAFQIGLVHRLATDETLDTLVDAAVGSLIKGGPEALAVNKRLAKEASSIPPLELAELIARLRTSTEAQEGMLAFLMKRPPAWIPPA